jgi:hypothetical protein
MQRVGDRGLSPGQRLLSVESIDIRAGIVNVFEIKSSISDYEVLSKSAHMLKGLCLHVCYPFSATPRGCEISWRNAGEQPPGRLKPNDPETQRGRLSPVFANSE